MIIINFLKKFKYLCLALVVAAGVLTFAFFSGGNVDKAVNKTATSDTVIQAETDSTKDTICDTADTSELTTQTVSVTESSTVETVEATTIKATDKKSDVKENEPTNTANKQESATKPKRTEKDKYKTDPIPEGKPEPVEPQEQEIEEDVNLYCTFSISCATILDNKSMLDKNKIELIPNDGWILKPVKVTFNEGESVFDVLVRVCKENKIQMEYSWTPIYNSAYIEGINNLYEFDCGSLSGWMYKVNDWFPNYGCSRYELKNGDTVEWKYTCDLGYDVGGGYATGE